MKLSLLIIFTAIIKGMESVKKFATILKKVQGRLQPEGDGATVRRLIGGSELKRLDPFLMMDYFNSALPGGFPDHPHRGFETVTYLMDGAIEHEDFLGNYGKIEKGDLQWMTAGRGIVHAEMPTSKTIPSVGVQIWINLPKKEKMCEPRYQEKKEKEILISESENLRVKVIAGKFGEVSSEIFCKTPVEFFDAEIQTGGKFEHQIKSGWNSFFFAYEGELQFGENKESIKNFEVVALEKHDEEQKLVLTSKGNTKFIFLAGKPINEEIYQRGPFVMNTQEEIYQTIEDFQLGKNGFENARNWESKIKYNCK